VPSSRISTLLGAGLLLAEPALAYRPFNGTDASVVTRGKFELELGPVSYYQIGGERDLVAPAVVLNYGVVDHVELVFQGLNYVALGANALPSRDRFVDTELSAKIVLREGCLQRKRGISVAAEPGLLLPQIGGESGAGAGIGGIVTQCLEEKLTVHYNVAVELTRELNLDLFGGAIVEGPRALPVRPVAELFIDEELNVGTTLSALVGAIWVAAEDLDFDVGLRVARSTDVGLFGKRFGVVRESLVYEVRLGLTWRFGG
jgi:hypothetical protein